jgi:hypothetical protein
MVDLRAIQELRDVLRELVERGNDEVMSTKRAAKHLDMSVKTFQKHINLIPHSQLGGKRLFRKSALDQYFDENLNITPQRRNYNDERVEKLFKEMNDNGRMDRTQTTSRGGLPQKTKTIHHR